MIDKLFADDLFSDIVLYFVNSCLLLYICFKSVYGFMLLMFIIMMMW